MLHFLVGLFAFLAIATILLELFFRSLPSYTATIGIGGPYPKPFWRGLKFALTLNRVSIFALFRTYAETFQKSYAFFGFGRLYVHIIKAEDMEKILNSSKHAKKSFMYGFLVPFLGDGLLISGGAKWAQRRRILTPAFHFNILQQFLKIFQEESVKLSQKLINLDPEERGIVNLPPLTSRHTLDTICETAMGVKLDSLEEPDAYRNNIYSIGRLLIDRSLQPWLANDFMFKILGYKEKLDKLLMPIHSFTRNIIEQRRVQVHEVGNIPVASTSEDIYSTRKQRYAMLDTLLAAEKNNQIDVEGIREEVDTFTFEGHDTTASGITMILFCLAENPIVQERVFKEIESIRGEKNGSSLEIADYSNMVYTDRVIKECFRLYPPVPFISRELTEDQEINGYPVTKGTMLALHIYDLHRDPEVFPDPERFDPDRFLPEHVERRHPFAYLPFSAGPRNCIGQKFALLEIKTVIESILMNFRLSPITHRDDIVFIADLVLRTEDPIKIKFTKRS
ncbi:probable cytochrome P450 4ac1 [Phlebotomus argentipes]|uniref:probable cytochrome P450 4ac1 n=1 Tax=Phlebotomus argentipes TaxID=94469 RepID=UPI00289361B0|nr:probable cytochrome P450 4ac1 [Phlebotomus argentipes]